MKSTSLLAYTLKYALNDQFKVGLVEAEQSTRAVGVQAVHWLYTGGTEGTLRQCLWTQQSSKLISL